MQPVPCPRRIYAFSRYQLFVLWRTGIPGRQRLIQKKEVSHIFPWWDTSFSMPYFIITEMEKYGLSSIILFWIRIFPSYFAIIFFR